MHQFVITGVRYQLAESEDRRQGSDEVIAACDFVSSRREEDGPVPSWQRSICERSSSCFISIHKQQPVDYDYFEACTLAGRS